MGRAAGAVAGLAADLGWAISWVVLKCAAAVFLRHARVHPLSDWV